MGLQVLSKNQNTSSFWDHCSWAVEYQHTLQTQTLGGSGPRIYQLLNGKLMRFICSSHFNLPSDKHVSLVRCGYRYTWRTMERGCADLCPNESCCHSMSISIHSVSQTFFFWKHSWSKALLTVVALTSHLNFPIIFDLFKMSLLGNPPRMGYIYGYCEINVVAVIWDVAIC